MFGVVHVFLFVTQANSLFCLLLEQILDGVQVYEARGRMGEKLAHLILSQFPATAAADASVMTADGPGQLLQQLDIDVVIPVPETSRTAALQCARILDRPYREVRGRIHFALPPYVPV